MTYRCGLAARWLPRILAAAVISAGTLLALEIDPRSAVPGSRGFRVLLVVVSAVVALWVVRRGAEVRVVIDLDAEGLLFGAGSRQVPLRFEAIEAMRYEPAFGSSKSWISATVLLDRDGRSWRLSSLLEQGGRLIEELLASSGRPDLASWAEAHRIDRRMGRAGRRTALGYAIAVAIVAAAALYSLR